jgi:hypothetical protein
MEGGLIENDAKNSRLEAMQCKKRALDGSEGESPNYVNMTTIDNPNTYIEVNVSLLQTYGARLYMMVEYDPPLVDTSGGMYYRSGYTKDVLVSFLKSLQFGQMVVGRGTTAAEMLLVFDYENVCVNRPATSTQRAMECVHTNGWGVRYRQKGEERMEMLDMECERVADAVISWPFLEMSMASRLGLGVLSRNGRSMASTDEAVSLTRAWVTFAKKPSCSTHVHSVRDLYTLEDRWLKVLVQGVGCMEHLMCAENTKWRDVRTQCSFNALAEYIESDSLGCLFFTRYATARGVQIDRHVRKTCMRGVAFFEEMRTLVSSAKSANGDGVTKDEALHYALAVAKLCEDMFRNMTDLSVLFCDACADDNGVTIERSALKNALSKRGVKILRWADHRNGLLFPPGIGETMCNNSNNPSSSAFSPNTSVLLSFDKLFCK